MSRTKANVDASLQTRLQQTRIGGDLLNGMQQRPQKSKSAASVVKPDRFDVIIEFNRNFPGGGRSARLTMLSAYSRYANTADPASVIPAEYLAAIASLPTRDLSSLTACFVAGDMVWISKSMWTESYLFGQLSSKSINALAAWTAADTTPAAPIVYKIWLDHEIKRCVYESVRTIKCDAARASFAASGKGVVWAVADTGIDAKHPHFKTFATTDLPDDLTHWDFTANYLSAAAASDAALTDTDGHGTHVAGIIAGFTGTAAQVSDPKFGASQILVYADVLVGDTPQKIETPYSGPISGLAPYCKLMSLKVLESGEAGQLSSLLSAIGFIQKTNDYGRHIKIHGLNLSLGYLFNPEWFAAGQSPLCVEVDLLVRSGVCVVAAAGNGGYGMVDSYVGTGERAAHLGTISDPGNAELAITVGSTHRDMPHAFGVSYFSAKGPTSDGRMKPDLVAPGERIISCALTDDQSIAGSIARFRSDSGTSMATPHVSGAIAAFLSVRQEFQGKPEAVKELFLGAATTLKRQPEFQGAGLVDLMRTLQSI